MDLPKQGIPNTCEVFEDISRVSRLSPAHLSETRRQFSFPAKTDIGIPLSDWSGDSVAPTHKCCGKLGFRSYVLWTWFKAHPGLIMSDTEELHIGDLNPSACEHVLSEGAHDFNDYYSDYAEQHPEFGFTDERVEAEVAKLDPDDKKFYEEYHGFLDTYYRQHGKIIEMLDLIKLIMTGRYPEIPSTTKKEQDELRDKLLIETRKREMSQQAGLEEGPPRKIR